MSGLWRPQLYNGTTGTHRTSDLNFVSNVYDNSCIRSDRTALILVSTFATDLQSAKIYRDLYQQLMSINCAIMEELSEITFTL